MQKNLRYPYPLIFKDSIFKGIETLTKERKPMLAKIFSSATLVGCLLLSMNTAYATCGHTPGSYTNKNFYYGELIDTERLFEDKIIAKRTNRVNSSGAPLIRNGLIRRYDIDGKHWDEGFGWWDPNNEKKPFARTMNALYLLTYAARDYSRSNNDNKGDILRWGHNYVAKHLHELVPSCSKVAFAGNYGDEGFFGFLKDERAELHYLFFYYLTVVERAGTLIHEARHAASSKTAHVRGCLVGGKSCDKYYGDHGALTYHVDWLKAFHKRGRYASRRQARDHANSLLSLYFVKPTRSGSYILEFSNMSQVVDAIKKYHGSRYLDCPEAKHKCITQRFF